MRKLIAVAAAIGFMLSAWQSSRAQDKPSPIKEAMTKGHKTGLNKKVSAGTASETEMKDLLSWYEGMAGAKPPKGDEAGWKMKCDDLISSLKGVQAKEAGATEKYTKAVNCMACHSAHKPA